MSEKKTAAGAFAGTKLLRVYMFISEVHKRGRVVFGDLLIVKPQVQFLSFKNDIPEMHPSSDTETLISTNNA